MQPKLIEKLVSEIIFLFNEFSRNINFNIAELSVTEKQYININNFINDVVIIVIKFLTKKNEKILADINRQQIKLKDKVYLILKRLDASLTSLVYYRNTIDASIASLVSIIKDISKQNLEIQNINTQNNQNDSSINSLALGGEKKVLLLTKQQKAFDLSLKQCVYKLKKEVNHVLEIFKSYKQEHSVFQKYVAYYKDSIAVEELESYQKFITGKLLEYVNNKLFTYIKKNIIGPDNKELKKTINKMLNSSINLSEKIVTISCVYCVVELLREKSIINNVNIFVSKVLELKDILLQAIDLFEEINHI